MSPDSLLVLTEQFKYTIALMYKALMNAEPVISKQVEVIAAMRLLGNSLLFVCFLVIMFVLMKTHQEAQGSKSMFDLKIKKRWIITMFAVFGLSLGVFNFYPGYLLMKLDQEIALNDADDAQLRLFGFDPSEQEFAPKTPAQKTIPLREEE